ncbi:hypothetical protein PIB30_090809 [Stylosanthes scabra]|uniref:Uncharacterized protein n=1 Tax=Stylosanthes scabra TaxID=79078 RepID=A0ABU6RUL7_9FABA|nr:hypothetical protein [Stylosanthes scabra]
MPMHHVRIDSGFGLQAILRDLLLPRTLFSHFRSELFLLKPETLERTHQGIVRNGKHFKTQQDRLLCRQGRQLQNTQTMIWQAFSDTVFTGLVQVSSAEGRSNGTEVLEESDAGS